MSCPLSLEGEGWGEGEHTPKNLVDSLVERLIIFRKKGEKVFQYSSMLRGLLCGIFIIGGFANPVRAQQTIDLEPIVVTAERFPVQERHSTQYTTVISSEELKEAGANNLADALRRTGGLAYTSRGPLGLNQGGMNSTLSIRGIKDGELVLINGVPILGAAGHGYDLSLIPLDQVERVEVLKGAASTLYGSDAMSGVINIITKHPSSTTSTTASVQFGNKNYHNHSINVQHPKIHAGFTYSHLDGLTEISRGFTKQYRYDTDDIDSYSFQINLTPFSHWSIDYLGAYKESGFQKIYDDVSTDMEGKAQKQYRHFIDVRYEHEQFHVKTFVNYDRLKRDEYTDPSEPEHDNKNYNYGLEGDYRFQLFDADMLLGGEHIYRGADYSEQYGSHHRNDSAVFLQLKKQMFQKLTMTVGGREQLIQGDADSSDYDIFLPSAGLNLKATETVNFFAHVGKAFRAPTFNNLYYSSSLYQGNPDLDPEKGWTYEAGIKFDHEIVSLRLAGFLMDYTNKIELDRSKGYPQVYFNAGDYSSHGVEWDMEILPFIRKTNFSQNIAFSASGYVADPVAEDDEGEEYQAGPKVQLSLGVSYLSDDLTLQLSGHTLRNRDRALDDYTTVDLYGKFKIWKGSMTVGVDNLFDEEIQISGDLRSTSTSQYLYYEVARLFKIGYEMTF